MDATKNRPPGWVGLAALLLVFALVGLGAALLAGAVPSLSGSTSSGSSSAGVSLQLPDTIVAVLFLGPVAVGLLALVLRWAVDSSSTASPGLRLGTTVAVAAVVALLLFAVYYSTDWTGTSHIAWGSASSGTGVNGSEPGNGTAGNGTPPNGTGHGTNSTGGNGTSGPGPTGKGGGKGTGHGGGKSSNNTTSVPRVMAPVSGGSYQAPNWAFLVVAALVSGSVALLAMPGMRDRSARGRTRRIGGPPGAEPPPDGAPKRSPLPVSALTVEDGETPRESIVRLYGHLLDRVEDVPERLSAATAEEIQQTRLTELQVAPERAGELTKLFEEARYSEHPMGRPDADRFVTTVQAIAHDLSEGGAPE